MKIYFIILLSAFLFSCSNSSHSSTAPAKKITFQNEKQGWGKIVVLGDSLAYGYQAKDNSSKPEACLAQLQNIAVYNFSYPGLTTLEISNRMSDVQSVHPKLVFLSSGGNDALTERQTPGSYPKSKSLNEMSQLFDQLIQTGALVVYLGLNPGFPGSERLPEISKLAESKGVIVVDGMNGFWGNSYLMADMIHPNDQGYKIMCGRILESIKGHYP